MKMVYRFEEDHSITDIFFRGLDGREQVTSTKEALQLMRIRNPGIDFMMDFRKGRYKDLSEEECERVANTVRCLQQLWRDPGEPEDAEGAFSMNPLTLLSNALRVITDQYVELEKYRNAEK